jgi:AraC-like DNA-binding protein
MATSSELTGDDLIALLPARDLQTLFGAAGVPLTALSAPLQAMQLPADLLDDPNGFIDPVQVWQLFSSLGLALNDEHFNLESRPVPAGTTELLVARAMHARTLGEAMNALAGAANLVLPDVRFSVKRRLDELHFCMGFPEEDNEARQILLEMSAIPFHATFRWLTGAPLPVRRFRTARSRPSRATHFLAVFNCSVQFEGTGIDIVYARELESIPLIARELADWRTGIYPMFLEDLDRRRAQFTGSVLTTYVERALRNGIGNQGVIAASAGMAEATLRRKLRAERTSFRALSDRVLADIAAQEVGSGATIEAIAERLGYADARSFRRAFQRVFGESPTELRARLQGLPSAD